MFWKKFGAEKRKPDIALCSCEQNCVHSFIYGVRSRLQVANGKFKFTKERMPDSFAATSLQLKEALNPKTFQQKQVTIGNKTFLQPKL